MGIEPYQVASSVVGVVAMRLLRRKASDGYRGRVPACEAVRVNDGLRSAIVRGADAEALRARYRQAAGYRSLADAARSLAASGVTDEAEVKRVLGI
jgi:type II secretory ATPase GspE/PulE/Tfp pilus assembly ATPase PilB-like protein